MIAGVGGPSAKDVHCSVVYTHREQQRKRHRERRQPAAQRHRTHVRPGRNISRLGTVRFPEATWWDGNAFTLMWRKTQGGI